MKMGIMAGKKSAQTTIPSNANATLDLDEHAKSFSSHKKYEQEKPQFAELPQCTIEDKIFNPDDVRFMLQLRSSLNKSKLYDSRGLTNKSMMVERPPSFYEDDFERYKNKFR
jgi:hypothetical protein